MCQAMGPDRRQRLVDALDVLQEEGRVYLFGASRNKVVKGVSVHPLLNEVDTFEVHSVPNGHLHEARVLKLWKQLRKVLQSGSTVHLALERPIDIVVVHRELNRA